MLNISNGCNEGTCNVTAVDDVKYRVLIHGSKLTLNTDFHSTEPFVIVETKKNKIASISKSNLDSIGTKENYCAADDTLIRTGCQITKVIRINIELFKNDEIFVLLNVVQVLHSSQIELSSVSKN